MSLVDAKLADILADSSDDDDNEDEVVGKRKTKGGSVWLKVSVSCLLFTRMFVCSKKNFKNKTHCYDICLVIT
jgi:hypothetical protein